MIEIINYIRKIKKPFFGICLGMQMAVIGFAREELGWEDADSLEFYEGDKKTFGHDVITLMYDTVYDVLGGTMRLGEIKCNIKNKNSLAYKIYKEEFIFERHRHRYEVNIKLVRYFEKKGLFFGGVDMTGTRFETIELDQTQHPFFFGCQYHPEFKSSVFNPSKPFYAFFLASAGYYDKLNTYKADENLISNLDNFIESNEKVIKLSGVNELDLSKCNCKCCNKRQKESKILIEEKNIPCKEDKSSYFQICGGANFQL